MPDLDHVIFYDDGRDLTTNFSTFTATAHSSDRKCSLRRRCSSIDNSEIYYIAAYRNSQQTEMSDILENLEYLNLDPQVDSGDDEDSSTTKDTNSETDSLDSGRKRRNRDDENAVIEIENYNRADNAKVIQNGGFKDDESVCLICQENLQTTKDTASQRQRADQRNSSSSFMRYISSFYNSESSSLYRFYDRRQQIIERTMLKMWTFGIYFIQAIFIIWTGLLIFAVIFSCFSLTPLYRDRNHSN